VKDLSEYTGLIRKVVDIFPQAYCTSFQKGFCIVWPVELAPIVATGSKPEKAWKAAAKLIKGKNEKSLTRLKARLIKDEVKRGNILPG
jgi:hypothetical protein